MQLQLLRAYQQHGPDVVLANPVHNWKKDPNLVQSTVTPPLSPRSVGQVRFDEQTDGQAMHSAIS